MKQYLDIVHNVLTYGKNKQPVRKGPDGKAVGLDNGTIALANVVFSHNMSDGFPLLTTKKMPLRVIAVELEGFLKGITDKTWFQERNCHIWDEWANPIKVQERLDSIDNLPESWDVAPVSRKEAQEEETDLGPIYGAQWRAFHGQTDQLKNIVDSLHKAPYDRRMVCSAWNPNEIHKMALPPCHYAWNVTVIDDEINLFWAQRSCDLMLGVPFNIASYALLLELLAKESGFKAGNLSGMLVDCHIYNNQIKGAYEQLQREPKKLPKIEITVDNDIFSSKAFSIFDWDHTNIKLSDYDSHGKIDFGGVTV